MKKYFIPSVILGFFVLDVLVSITHFGNTANDLYRNILLGVGQLIAIFAGVYSVRVLGLKNPTGKSVMFFTLGLVSSFLGSSIFAFYDFTSGNVEFPSIADVFILCGYPLFFIGLLSQIKSEQIHLTRSNGLLLLLFSSLLALVVVYFGIILPFDPVAPFMVNFVQACYGIVDLILIIVFVFVLLLAFDYKGGKFFYPWFYIFIGVLITLFGDIMFGIFVKDYTAKSGINIIIDLVWRLSYVFYAYGLFRLGSIILDVQKNILQRMQTEKKK
jgi:hypothetical protein